MGDASKEFKQAKEREKASLAKLIERQMNNPDIATEADEVLLVSQKMREKNRNN